MAPIRRAYAAGVRDAEEMTGKTVSTAGETTSTGARVVRMVVVERQMWTVDLVEAISRMAECSAPTMALLEKKVDLLAVTVEGVQADLA